MIKSFTRLFSLSMLVLASVAQVNGQGVFFSETFASFPATWTSVVRVGNNQPSSAWFHTTEGPTGPFATADLNATTANNGWMIFDSDLNCNIGVGQDAWLISPAIDASDKAVVFLRFQTYYRRFLDVANVRVGTNLNDLDNWATIDVFPGLTNNQFGGGDATVNPTIKEFNISQWAAGQAQVYFAFQFLSTSAVSSSADIGCAYSWQVDDVELTSQDLTIVNDMRVNTFFARAINTITPASQLEPMGFLADIENIGAGDQTGATLTATIENADEEVIFTSTINYGAIAADSVAENVFFPTQFTPPGTPGEAYTGKYTLTLNGTTDERPDNNVREFDFIVSDTTFAKELGSNLGGFSATSTSSYSWGNIYYVPNGDGYVASTVSFALGNAEALAGRSVTTLLYKWNGDLNDDGQVNPAEYGSAPISFNSYTIEGTETGANALITIPIDIDGNQIALEDNSYYLLAIQYTTEDNVTMSTLATNQIDYTGMWFYTDSLGSPRYGSAFDPGNTGTYGFVFTVSPLIRLNIGALVSTEELPLPAGAVAVFPNPANEQIVLDLNFEQSTPLVDITVMDITGKTVITERRQNIQQEQLALNSARLPAGTYNVRIRTNQGVTVKRIVVQH